MLLRAVSQKGLKAALTLIGVTAVGTMVATPFAPTLNLPAAWYGYGGNAQHSGISKYAVKGLGNIAWSVPIDEDLASSSSGSEVLIHYPSPCITKANTVVIGVHNNIGGNHDSWRVQGMDGSNGNVKWSYNTDYSAPILMPSDWTSVYPLSLASMNAVVAGGGGGTVLLFPNADTTAASPIRLCFWGSAATYTASPASYANIKICTPITGDPMGNFWFGYRVLNGGAGVPANVLAAVGDGGIVKGNVSGGLIFKKAASVFTNGLKAAMNNAPVLSNDYASVYEGFIDTNGKSWLVKMDSRTLNFQAQVQMIDPFTGAPASLIVESSGSPIVGPDGHVFMGVFGSSYRESHGWMLQFDKNLSQFDSNNKRWPVGAFGWDDSASIVPSSAVPPYRGSASYLILTKYNNYFLDTGNGRNQLALLDPTSDSLTKDRLSGIPTMNAIEAVTGVTCDADYYACTPTTDVNSPSVPVREWCINAAAIDPATKSAVVNSEDGHAYRWDFTLNKLTQSTYLQPATAEAYTCTVVGPDGTAYAINNGVLNALHP